MRIKVSEATPNQLDWMVAKCLQVTAPKNNPLYWKAVFSHWEDYRGSTRFSTEWAQGGPIIEREGILLRPVRKDGHKLDGQWLAKYDVGNTGSMVHWSDKPWFPLRYHSGPTLLIAAMRCFVASKFGDEVETPEDL